jgi:transcriptional regulator with XRE-family HTH domain
MMVDSVLLTLHYDDVTPTKDPTRSEYSADQLRIVLTRSGVNYSELARRLGRSREWVSGRARGAYVITPQDAVEIVRGLGVGLSDLMDTPSVPVLRRLASVLQDVQVNILDDEDSTDEEKQWILQNIRWMYNQILTSPYRAERKRAKQRRRGGE